MKNSYDKFRDTGIDWLKVMPEHWEVKKLKYVTSCNDESLPETTDPDYQILYVDISSVSGTSGIIAKEEMSFEDAPSRARRIVKDGDTIVSTVRTYLKAIAPINDAEDNLIVSTGFAVLRPLNMFPSYLSLVIQSHYVVESIVARSVGVSYPAINANDIGNIFVPVPPINEQLNIANKVQNVVSSLDALIRKKEQMIELLKEKRIALITQAVTKGLDPNVKMKDSGIEWLGEVPEHWEIQKLKRVCKFAYGDSLPDDDRNDEQIPVYGSNGIVGFHDMSNTLSPAIIVGRKGSYGKLNYTQDSAFAIDTTYYIDRKTTSHNIRWLFYMLTILRLDEGSKDSAVPGLAREDAYSLAVPVCDPDEQQAIASFLDRETGHINALIQKNEQIIELLKEYRTSLIHHAVTGKIDLRGYDDQLR